MGLLRVVAKIAAPVNTSVDHQQIIPVPVQDSSQRISAHSQDQSNFSSLRIHEQSRRAALCLLGAASLSVIPSQEASAFSPGFSGLKDWLKGQKQKNPQFLLAPIDASRERLNSALLLLTKPRELSTQELEEAARLVKVASRDCMPASDGSLIGLQSKTGVEVCTFKLVLKNAASLLADNDPLKLTAEQNLQALIRSFVILDGLLDDTSLSNSVDREGLTRALQDTYRSLDQFGAGVRSCNSPASLELRIYAERDIMIAFVGRFGTQGPNAMLTVSCGSPDL
ncbi:hypothetical protein R1sor_007900 [Riccia sorocarpa]|uniref:Uncharacterized protein n=1 Tax=Riccia sorocarpa TaxID=122646 RepID=A0ABD3HY41_9MARC